MTDQKIESESEAVLKTQELSSPVPPRPSSQTSQRSIPPEEQGIATSPTGRFIKFDKIIGDGSFKTVHQGFDTEFLIAVAWCELKERHISPEDRKRFFEEAHMLKKLDHPNIVKYLDYFELPTLPEPKYIIITELLVSGTLKSYLKRLRTVKEKVLKNWCRQILSGLLYLHTRTPPIIHRDLKCDNIFINGSDGSLKLGDLGLATNKLFEFARSVIGTPEFMAPEMYDECYDEAIDVYAFGMCLIEMITGEYPYSECTNAAQIYRKVTQGLPPDGIERIFGEEIKKIVMNCIKHDKNKRYKVKELLALDYFKPEELIAKEDLVSSPIYDSSYNFTLLSNPSSNIIENPQENSQNCLLIRLLLNLNNSDPNLREETTIEFKYYQGIDTFQSVINDLIDYKIIPGSIYQKIFADFEKFMNSFGFNNQKTNENLKLPHNQKSRRLVKVNTIYGLSKHSEVPTDRLVNENDQKKDLFILLSIKSITNESIVECGMETTTSKLTFKFSSTEDSAEEIGRKLTKNRLLSKIYYSNFTKSLNMLINIMNDPDLKDKKSEISRSGFCFKIYPDNEDREITMFNENGGSDEEYISISDRSVKTQKIDLSQFTLDRNSEELLPTTPENVIKKGFDTNIIELLKTGAKELKLDAFVRDNCNIEEINGIFMDLIRFYDRVTFFHKLHPMNRESKSFKDQFENLTKKNVEDFIALRKIQENELWKLADSINERPKSSDTHVMSAPLPNDMTYEELTKKSMEELKKMSFKVPPTQDVVVEQKPTLDQLKQAQIKAPYASCSTIPGSSQTFFNNGAFPYVPVSSTTVSTQKPDTPDDKNTGSLHKLNNG